MVTAGGNQAFAMVALALLDPGDRVLLVRALARDGITGIPQLRPQIGLATAASEFYPKCSGGLPTKRVGSVKPPDTVKRHEDIRVSKPPDQRRIGLVSLAPCL